MNLDSFESFCIYLGSRSTEITDLSSLPILILPDWSLSGYLDHGEVCTYGINSPNFKAFEISLCGERIIWTWLDRVVDFYRLISPFEFKNIVAEWVSFASITKSVSDNIIYMHETNISLEPDNNTYANYILDLLGDNFAYVRYKQEFVYKHNSFYLVDSNT